jgi:hypothetical protein
MPLKVRRTIVVGLGGTGLNAMLHMKKEFLDHHDEVPPLVRLLGFDTTTTIAEKPLYTSDGRPVALTGSEFTYIPVRNPMSLLDEFPEVRREFPVGRVELRALIDGAHAVRACGRLAVLANAVQIRNLIEDAYSDVNDATALDRIRDNGEFEESPDPKTTLYVVCSLAGGTGGGAFLDIAYLARDVLDVNDRIIAILLMPEIFAGLPGTSSIRGNAYAALRELDFLLDRAGREGTPDIVDYGNNIRLDWAKFYPFNQVYLVDNKNENGVMFNDLEQMQRFIGKALFVNTNVVAKQGEDVLDNVAGRNADSDPWNDKKPNYASFGAAALDLPMQQIVDLSVYLRVSALIHSMLGGDREKIESDVTEFLKQSKLAEAAPNDDVTDALIPPPGIEPAAPGEILDNPGVALHSWFTGQIALFEREYDRIANENAPRVTQLGKERIAQFVERAVLSRGGVDYASAFARSLLVRLGESRHTMEEEEAEYARRKSEECKKHRALEEIERNTRGLFNRTRVEKEQLELTTALKTYSDLTRQIVRRKAAADVFTALEQYVQQLKCTLDAICASLSEAADYTSKRVHALEAHKGVNTFTKYLGRDSLKEDVDELDKQVTVEWVLHQMAGRGVPPLAWTTAEWDGQAIAERMAQVVLEKYKQLLDVNIEQVLARLKKRNESNLYSLLREYLVDRATPLWKYDVDAAKRRELTEVFILGVGNQETSILKDLDPAQFGASFRRASWASTGSAHSLAAFKYKLRVPAYVLDGIEELRDDYQARQERRDYTHHIRRSWAENPDMLGDLIPERSTATDEQLMYWAVAFAEPFKKVVAQPGGRYYIISRSLGDETQDYKVQLPQGRVKAFQAFVGGPHKEELFAELRESIDSAVASLGSDRVAEALQAYRNQVLEMMRGTKTKVSKDIERMLNLELGAIAKFVERVGTLR